MQPRRRRKTLSSTKWPANFGSRAIKLRGVFSRRALFFCLAFACVAPLARASDAPAPPDFASLHLQPLPLASWLADDKITATSSPHDIGELKDVFDGDISTLLRSSAVNPQITTIQFDGTVSVAGTRVLISHHVGRWKIEAMVWPKDAKTPVNYQIVPWTNAGDGVTNEIIFPRNLAVSEITLTAQRTGGDDYVHLNEWELLTEIKTTDAG